MSALTLDDLKALMQEAAGADETVDLDGDIADVAFTELGYDSLAMLETAAIISRRYGVVLTDDLLDGIDTPGALLAEVNSALAAAV
jgi:act minimal PKS acyl carrier protein